MDTYTVQSGDSMTSIAANFGVTLAALEAANPQISNPNMLSVGQVLTLPGISTPSLTTGSSAQGNSVQAISVQNVDFTLYSGGGDISTWISQACQAAGSPANSNRINGFLTLCNRESNYNPNAINTTDYNASGPIVGDGHPQHCSRCVAQFRPSTFAAYHVAGASNGIYNPVANIAAASQYIISSYQVPVDGSDFAAKAQQADPNRPPHGY
jgi:murein DD-endopeptidase MepM/ murein hydrolase activator NlpD